MVSQMFYCDYCGVEREIKEYECLDFAHYVCPVCLDDFMFISDGYYIPEEHDDKNIPWDYILDAEGN